MFCQDIISKKGLLPLLTTIRTVPMDRGIRNTYENVPGCDGEGQTCDSSSITHSQQLASPAISVSNTTSFRQRCTGRMFAAAGSRYYYIRLCSDIVNCTKTKLGAFCWDPRSKGMDESSDHPLRT